MSQVVFSPDVGDLFGLHGLQLGTVGNTMTQTAAERAAPLSCEYTRTGCVSKGLQKLLWNGESDEVSKERF